MVGAIQGSTQREPLVVGKPSTFMMDYLANEYVKCVVFLVIHVFILRNNISTVDLEQRAFI